MDWIFYKGQDVFSVHKQQWDELNASVNNHVLLDATFWEELVAHFADETTLLGISQNRDYPGMVLVKPVGFGMWSTFQPSQAPIGPILLYSSQDIEGQLRRMLQSLPGYALGIGVTQQDPAFSRFHALQGLNEVEIRDYVTTARIPVTGAFDDYWSARGQDLRKNVRKRISRLEREGFHTSLTVHELPDDMERCIQEYGRLEESGWKGRGGTAVGPDNVQGRFYQKILERACRANEGVVYSLRLNGKTVAQKICVRRGAMIVFLKMAYDEQYRHLAPGYILQYEILKRLFADQQIECVETYGRVNEGWTDKWTHDFRTMCHVNYFRHTGLILAKRFLARGVSETQEVG